MEQNPKTKPTSNAEKDPQDWVTGDEPMTGAQASYLKTLSEQTHRPGAFDGALTKAQASERIEQLKAALDRIDRARRERASAMPGILQDERGQDQPASKEDAQRSSGDVRNRQSSASGT